jgi:metal-dependent amidase/aminoacylase/carboxypeptidase family protein
MAGGKIVTRKQLKQAVCEAIDRHGNQIIELGETILHHPETGFNEAKTAAVVADTMRAIGLEPQTGLALDRRQGAPPRQRARPAPRDLGELDSLRTSDHPLADPHTGAAHSCGHNAQVAGMLGVAMGLLGRRPRPSTSPASWCFFAVPAEEFIDVEERLAARQKGDDRVSARQARARRQGHFDDIDMAMMIHVGSHDQM